MIFITLSVFIAVFLALTLLMSEGLNSWFRTTFLGYSKVLVEFESKYTYNAHLTVAKLNKFPAIAYIHPTTKIGTMVLREDGSADYYSDTIKGKWSKI